MVLGIGYTKQVISVKLQRARRVIPLAFEVATGGVEEGALVALADGRIGFVQMVSASPYGEPFQRCYVYAADWCEPGCERWADWVTLDELTVIG